MLLKKLASSFKKLVESYSFILHENKSQIDQRIKYIKTKMKEINSSRAKEKCVIFFGLNSWSGELKQKKLFKILINLYKNWKLLPFSKLT